MVSSQLFAIGAICSIVSLVGFCAGFPILYRRLLAWMAVAMFAGAFVLWAGISSWPSIFCLVILISAAAASLTDRLGNLPGKINAYDLRALLLAICALFAFILCLLPPTLLNRIDLAPILGIQGSVNPGKALAGCVLLAAAISPHAVRLRLQSIVLGLALGMAVSVILACVSVFTGLLRWGVTHSAQEVFAWTWVNVLFAVASEEVFFRQFVQIPMERMKLSGIYPFLPVFLSATLFGVSHLAGGLAYATLAIFAGFFNAYAFYKTRRLEASIACHATLNLARFSFFV